MRHLEPRLSYFVFSASPILLSGGTGIHPGISKAFNLALFLGVMYLLVRKPVAEFFATRFATVRATLEHAAKEKDAAAAKMAELDARLNRLDEELKSIRAQTEVEAAAERARVEADTKQDLEKIRQSARREIEAAKQIAMGDLREFAATKAVDLAEQMIRREIKPEDDARLLHRMADEMGRVN
jgi:F0F1-type ATP synthase membrane subunit b/b'